MHCADETGKIHENDGRVEKVGLVADHAITGMASRSARLENSRVTRVSSGVSTTINGTRDRSSNSRSWLSFVTAGSR